MAVDSNYSYLVQRIGESKIQSRIEMICEMLLNFISQENLVDRVAISEELVTQVVIDYFVDIDRLKSFQEIDLVNEIKIYSYLSYWLLRRKPLQIIETNNASDLKFVNEEMVSSFLESFLLNNPANISISHNQRAHFDSFIQTLRYYLKYRAANPQCIELMIHAFLGGRAYQYSVDYQS